MFASPFDRIIGSPVLSTSCQTVDSLHPDIIDRLPVAGTSIELLLVTRCHKSTVGSTLLDEHNRGDERPMKLSWALYVVWKDGVVERRGLGQMLESALEDVVDEKPVIKSVLLG